MSLCILKIIIAIYDFWAGFLPTFKFLYNLTRIILNFNEIYKNHKIQKIKWLKNEKDLMLYLIMIFELFKFDVTVFARPVS